MTTAENHELYAQEDAKRLKRFKFLYPFYEFIGGMSKSFSTYLTFFYTNVFMFSVTFTATMTLISNVISWIGTPTFAAFLDRFSFKKAKFWPWVMIGSFVLNGATILIVALPVLTGKTVELAALVFGIRILMTVLGPMGTTPISGSFPRMGKTPEDRQYFAMSQKVGRDGGKTVFGYIVPPMLIFLSGGGDEPTMIGYAITCLICYGSMIAAGWMYALIGLKGSYVEREAMADTAASKKAKVPLSVVFKVLFTNRPVLGMFMFMMLHKSYYFIYTSYAAYVFRYVYQDFGKLSLFFTSFNLLAIIGVMFGPLWSKIFKESKRSFVAAFIAHMAFLVVLMVTFKSISANTFIIIFGASSFFMGMLENWVMPMFAASSDYGAWKTGTRMDAFIMSIYSLSVTASMFVTTIVGSALLNSFDYTNWLKAYNAGTVGITPEVVNGLSTLFSVAPFVISCVALCSLLFVFNLTDPKIRAIQADIKEGKTEATSQLDFKSLK